MPAVSELGYRCNSNEEIIKEERFLRTGIKHVEQIRLFIGEKKKYYIYILQMYSVLQNRGP